ncbi:hypothetical protein MKOR_07540 [Mycolicibacillus koreensis]|nr:hypothetical protein MKOR_07540 [Mycolicibacillus koreensis]
MVAPASAVAHATRAVDKPAGKPVDKPAVTARVHMGLHLTRRRPAQPGLIGGHDQDHRCNTAAPVTSPVSAVSAVTLRNRRVMAGLGPGYGRVCAGLVPG